MVSITRAWLGPDFVGFVSVADMIQSRLQQVPELPGVYAVLRESSRPVAFHEKSPGGWFKGKDPTVPTSVLDERWILDTTVVYIGMTDRTLRLRLQEFLDFGQGKPVGHRGGRCVWQMKDANASLLAWLPVSERGASPSESKRALLASFVSATGRLPFANLRR